MNKITILILFVNLFIHAGTTIFKGAEYTTTDATKTIAWDAPTPNPGNDPEFYEVRLVWIDVTPNVTYDLGRTSNLQFDITFPRSGHFIAQVRSGRYDPTTDSEVFSVWIDSIDENVSLVDNEPMGWRIQKKLEPPVWE